MNKVANSWSRALLLSVFATSLLWCIKSFEVLFHVDLAVLGVRPGEPSGLIGILTAPLIHGSLAHLFSNTLPLILLGSVLLYGYPRSRYRVIALVWLVSGFGVWLFARPSVHIGASGLTHGLFFYLLLVSLLRRDKQSLMIMMIAFFLYGGMTMTIFPREEGISFEYHFFGAVAGVIAALLWHSRDPAPVEKKYAWEITPDDDDELIGEQWNVPAEQQDNERQ